MTADRLAELGVSTDVSTHCTAIRLNGQLIAILPSDPSRQDLAVVVELLQEKGVETC